MGGARPNAAGPEFPPPNATPHAVGFAPQSTSKHSLREGFHAEPRRGRGRGGCSAETEGPAASEPWASLFFGCFIDPANERLAFTHPKIPAPAPVVAIMNNPIAHKCPHCAGEQFQRRELPHPLLLHWILNPALIFNEIALGQRLPKTLLICQGCDGPLIERQYVPCTFCGAMHSAMHGKFFGLWRGARCTCCDRPIPLLWNVFSVLVLGLTLPFWGLPYHLHFRKKPLTLFGIAQNETPGKPKQRALIFIRSGVLWGGVMWLVTGVLPAWKSKANPARWNAMLSLLPIWAVGGFLFGCLLWFFIGRDRTPLPAGTPKGR